MHSIFNPDSIIFLFFVSFLLSIFYSSIVSNKRMRTTKVITVILENLSCKLMAISQAKFSNFGSIPIGIPALGSPM